MPRRAATHLIKASTYDVGDVVRLRATWTDTGDVAVTAVAPRFLVRKPDQTVTVYTTASGVIAGSTDLSSWYCDISITESGRWRYRVESTSNTQAASESWFKVQKERVST